MKSLAIGTLLLLLACAAVAQVPDKPQPQTKIKCSGPVNSVRCYQVEAKPRVVDGKFVIVQMAGFAGVIADVESSVSMLNRGCRETNVFAGSNPSRARLYAITGGIQVAMSLLSYYAKRKGVKGLWLLPPLALGGAHGFAAIHNNGLSCN